MEKCWALPLAADFADDRHPLLDLSEGSLVGAIAAHCVRFWVRIGGGFGHFRHDANCSNHGNDFRRLSWPFFVSAPIFRSLRLRNALACAQQPDIKRALPAVTKMSILEADNERPKLRQ